MRTHDGGAAKGRKVMCYIGYRKGQPRPYLDIVYPGTTQIDDMYDYVPLFHLPSRPKPSILSRVKAAIRRATGVMG